MPAFDSPDAAEAAFYHAFSECDSDAMGAVWRDDDAVTCVHPGGGLLSGVASVLASWQSIFSQADPPQLDYQVLQRLLDDRLAVHLVAEAIRPDGSRETPTRVIATNISRRDDDGWHLTAHHASLPLVGQRARSAMH